MSIVRPDMETGEAWVGEGPEAAHVNTALGREDGPVGTAWATALANPQEGHAPFVAVLQPGLPVKPMTLLVNRATLTDEDHDRMVRGPTQAGVAAGVADAVAEGAVAADEVDGLVVIVSVRVTPEARDADAVYRNHRDAVRAALASGNQRVPKIEEVLDGRHAPENPHYRAPTTDEPQAPDEG